MSLSKSIKAISINKNNCYEFNKAGLKKMLLNNDKLVDREIVSISIAGPMRKGKSFLMGFFLRYLTARYVKHDVSQWLGNPDDPLEGFEWKNGGLERTTTGINIWNEVFLHDASDGSKYAIILIDTQGVFDQYSTVKDNNVIFAVSTLLSSMQIFNLMNNIQEDDFQSLQMFAAYGKLAASTSSDSPFQQLMFIIRDWSDSEVGFGVEGGKKLLEKRFKVGPELQSTRNDIKSAFESIECFLMPHPGFEVTEEKTFKGEVNRIRPQFIKQLEVLVPRILAPENLIPKMINGKTMNAREFINYLDTFVTFFNRDEIPTPENFMEATAKACNLNAVMKGFDKYAKIFKDNKVEIKTIEEFDRMHNEVKAKIFIDFDKDTKFGGPVHAMPYRKMLDDKIEELFKPFREEVLKRLEKGEKVDAEEINIIFQGLRFIIEAIGESIEQFFKTIAETVVNKTKEFIGNIFR